jgi:hypothetical protein
MRFQVVKGCAALGVQKGTILYLIDREDMGAAYSHQCKVRLRSWNATIVLYARFYKYTDKEEFNLNNGNPMKSIRLRRIG